MRGGKQGATLALVWMLLLPSIASAQDVEVPEALRPYMTVEEFKAAGLHRLSPEELTAYQAIFLRAVTPRTPSPSPAAPVVEKAEAQPPTALVAETERSAEPLAERDASSPSFFGLERLRSGRESMEARMVGTFTGWSGQTRVTLDNGQVWETIRAETFRPLQPLDEPKVTIRAGSFGSYIMRVEGYNAFARVRRIE